MSRTRPTGCVGVDIGGTKIAAGVVDASGAVLDRETVPTPRGSTAVLDAVQALVSTLTSGSPPEAVGVGAPGVVDTTTGDVVSATDILTEWAGTAVGSELRRRLSCPVVVDNDVRMMAAGEMHVGAARGLDDVVFVSIGTGVGGAIVRRGAIVHGPHFTGGEIGHLLVPAEGAIVCGCGRRDHLEAVASGPAIAAAYARLTGNPLTLPEVVERMLAGDPHASTIVVDAATVAGRAIAGLVSAIDVAAVVVGGGVAQIGEPFLDPLRAAFNDEVLPALDDVGVWPAALGTDAPIVGAALAAFDALSEPIGAVS